MTDPTSRSLRSGEVLTLVGAGLILIAGLIHLFSTTASTPT